MILNFFLFLITLFTVSCSSNFPKGERANELRLNLFCEPPSLDSRKATDATSMNVLMMLFEGLTRFDREGRPGLAAAKSLEVSKDKKEYIFRLKESYWSNGDPLVASDFLYAWKKILDPKFPSLFAYKLYVIENAAEIKEGKLPIDALGVYAPDDKTLVIKLVDPIPYFLELTAFPTFYPIHQKTDETEPNWAHETFNYVSNGPFQLKKWVHESEICVEKNPFYWDACSVKLDKIHLAMIDDTATEFYMFEMGELDWAGSPLSNLSPEFLPALKKDCKVHIIPAAAVYYYKINTDKFPLGNKNLRKALALSINRKALVEHVTQADQQPATSLVRSMHGWEKSNFFLDADVNSAKKYFIQALDELGITEKEFPTLKLCYNTNKEHQKIAQAIQQQWQSALNIHVDLENYDWKVYLSKINKQDYEIGRMGWVGDFYDPISFLEPFKYRDNPHIGGNNETGWENPEYAELLEKARKENNHKKRAVYLKEAEKILIDEMPIIPLYFINFSYLKKNYVKDVYISSLGLVDYKKAYIDF